MDKAFRTIALLLVCATVVLLTGRCFSTERAVRVSDGSVIGFDRMIREVKGAKLVFVGEVHDQKAHHEAQLRTIKALHKAGTPIAIGLEMFTADSQHDLDRWVAGRMEKERFIRLYYDNWQMPWPLYGDILHYARQNRIPLIGLNVPRDVAQKVSSKGFAALTRDEKKKLPSGITCDVDAAYTEFIKKAYAQHARNDKSFIHFCEAQMLWNKTMAWHLARFLEKHPKYTVVVLVGAGHALKRGIPAEVEAISGFNCKVILPEMSDMPARAVTGGDADYVLLLK
ncbi:MAG: hypothetical protein FD174_534 [Geobacteraceae bacterium]|nr:MAG: hypothetical protein FD174_534 [Geobacteraceae bacterium]